MKKYALLMVVFFWGMIATTANAQAVYMVGDVYVKSALINNGQAVRFTWTFDDVGDMWMNDQIMFYADPIRDQWPGFEKFVPGERRSPFQMEKEGVNTLHADIPMEVITEWGQSGFNLAGSNGWLANVPWLGLPDCSKVHLDEAMIFYRSVADKSIPNSGGMHVLYIGSGAPFVPKADDPMIYRCSAGVPIQSTPVAPAPVLPIGTQQVTYAVPAGYPTTITINNTVGGKCNDASPVAEPKKVPCKVTITGDRARTDVLKKIIEAYFGAEVSINVVNDGGDNKVNVVGNNGTESVGISDKLLGKLNDLVANPNAGDSFLSLCPTQAGQLRQVIKCD